MKNITIKCLGLFFCMTLASSCEDFESRPLEWNTEDYVWDETDINGTYAQGWVAKMYSYLPQGGYTRFNGKWRAGGVPQECLTDDAVPSDPANGMWNTIRGGYSATSTFDNNWSGAYKAIRHCNIFLANYKRVPWASEDEPKYLEAEMRFLRAYHYFELVRRFGGVPLIGDRIFKPTDNDLLTLKRNSFADCIDYIISECDAVKDNLRQEFSLAERGKGKGKKDGNDPLAGRIRKSIVLAFKARVLLYAASPLFNGTGDNERLYLGYPEYDKNRWKLAADAVKEVMDMGLYDLEPSRYTLNYTYVNKEIIWMRTYYSQSDWYGYVMSPVGFRVKNKESMGIVSPTQELVDAFPMKNGKFIDEVGSGYKEDDPYANRDPRLNETVFYNGSRWLKQTVETFEGGKNKPNNVSKYKVQTVSGYYAKRHLYDETESTTYHSTHFNGGYPSGWVMIRYADLLLMYAEAQNEYLDSPDQSVYDAIEKIRKRAGLDPYQLPENLSQEGMRKYIRNERRVEMAFEESRFWDIRRWKIAKDVYTKPLHGMKIEKDGEKFKYTKIEIAQPYFSDEMYLFPIALKETQVNDNMEQNPGY